MEPYLSAFAKRNKLMYKIVLKNILAYIMSAPFQCDNVIKRLSRLSKVQIMVKIDKTLIKEKELQCFRCRQIFTSKLSFILHLELMHRQQISIVRYEFDRDKLTIYVETTPQKPFNFVEEDENHLTLKTSYKDRLYNILDIIFRKFINKRARKGKRVYYHSNNIFAEIGTSSEEEDSENEVGYIERDLERHRINDFTDVNEKDKALFYIWNDMVHQHKKTHKVIDHGQMVKILENFARECKKQGIKRMNFFTHAWTLWSAGKVVPEDVSQALTAYDGYQ